MTKPVVIISAPDMTPFEIAELREKILLGLKAAKTLDIPYPIVVGSRIDVHIIPNDSTIKVTNREDAA